MPKYKAVMTLNGTYEFTVEAENKTEAELEAVNTEIYLSRIEHWDTELELTEDN